ncbi:ABC transporter substrate-binding protein [Micromonospora sp. NPDC006766]|uniref:ABC transporter substrate-binding protein n=1 Tax=Micromonospora sp. NPDC006766 TaxID=3154778 RepID=UPI0033CB9854
MLPNRTSVLRRLGAIVAVSAALLAAGCANKGGSSEPVTGTDAMRLNVGQISDSVAFFPLFVAEQEGYFKAEGLTLGERPRLGTGAKLAAAVQSGSIDIAGGVMTDAFNLYKVNNKARVVGSLVDAYYVDIIAGPGIPSAGDSAPMTERIQALRGKKIGMTGPGSGTEALVNYLFKQANLDPKTDATLVNLGADASAAIGALKAGRVDALSFFQPIGQQAVATGVGRIYISPARGDVPALKDAIHGALFTTRDVIDRKGKAVAAFLRAIAKAEQTINGDPAKTGELLQKYQKTMNPQTVEALVPVLQAEIPDAPTPNEAGYNVSADFHRQTGLVPNPPAYADIVPSEWITSALNG